MMLAVLNLPMIPNQGQEAIRRRLLRPETGQSVNGVFGVFDNLAPPHLIDLAVDA
jgi:hypothetical protein